MPDKKTGEPDNKIGNEMEAEQREELRRLADQCICHPLSRGVSEVEQAGEGIKELLDELADTEKAYALLFAENARLRRDAERLDWLESSPESHGFCHVSFGEYLFYAHQMRDMPTVREVIDKAMEAK